MKKGFWKEGLTKGQKALGILFLSCVVLFFLFSIMMFVGVFTHNKTVMWVGVGGVFVCLLGILNIKIE